MSIRRPLEFTGAAGTYAWPRYALEYDASQALEGATIQLVGADYEFDQLGDAPAIKRPGQHTIRFLLVGEAAAIEAQLDEMRAKLYLGGRGWLVVEDDAGVKRRCRARINEMPSITLGTRDRQRAPVILTFTQQSDFYDVDPVSSDWIPITATPETVVITNPGNAVVRNAIVYVKGPFSGLVLTNQSLAVPGLALPYVFETTREAADGTGWLRVDAGANVVEYSADDGGTWADDAANVVLQPGQVGLFAIGPGDNNVAVEGAVGGELSMQFAGAWV